MAYFKRAEFWHRTGSFYPQGSFPEIMNADCPVASSYRPGPQSLLTLPQTRFLLMSATLGDVAFFEEALTGRNGRPTVTVKSIERPVPLDHASIPRSPWRRR